MRRRLPRLSPLSGSLLPDLLFSPLMGELVVHHHRQGAEAGEIPRLPFQSRPDSLCHQYAGHLKGAMGGCSPCKSIGNEEICKVGRLKISGMGICSPHRSLYGWLFAATGLRL